jgi:uncharacterized protein YkwD
MLAAPAGALAVAAALAAAPAAAGSCHRGDRPGASRLGALRMETVCLINRARIRHGERRLRVNRPLGRAARRHARAMVRHREFSHVTAFDESPASRAARAGYLIGARRWLVAEDMGWTSARRRDAAESAVRAWLHSPPHRHVILRPGMRDVGVGVAVGTPPGRRGFTFVADFGAR